MNREQRRKELKRARFERSRRVNHWDGKEVVARVFGPGPIAQQAEALQHREHTYDGQNSALFDQISQYMKAMGVPTIMLMKPDRAVVKDAVLCQPERLEHQCAPDTSHPSP